MNGKGSKARPLSVDSATFGAHYEAIFGKSPEKTPETPDRRYQYLLDSGLFWEFHPELSGRWDIDRDIFLKKLGDLP